MRHPAVWIVALVASIAIATADDPPVAPVPAPPLEARVPVFANRNCPMMGKKASTALFVDTDMGRIYVCCMPCVEEILADTAAAHRAAYPVVKKLANAVGPISGKAIEKDSPRLVLQGFEFSLHSADLAPAARATSQVVLARLANPALRDVGNRRCPVTGGPVSVNSPVLIGDDLIHLAGKECVVAVKKDPAAMLARAKVIALEDRANEAQKGAPNGSDHAGK